MSFVVALALGEAEYLIERWASFTEDSSRRSDLTTGDLTTPKSLLLLARQRPSIENRGLRNDT